MTWQTRRERAQLGQSTLTTNAQGHRPSTDLTAGAAPIARRAAPRAQAPSFVKRVRNACDLIIAPNRIASLRLIAPLRESAIRSPDLPAAAASEGSSGRAPLYFFSWFQFKLSQRMSLSRRLTLRTHPLAELRCLGVSHVWHKPKGGNFVSPHLDGVRADNSVHACGPHWGSPQLNANGNGILRDLRADNREFHSIRDVLFILTPNGCQVADTRRRTNPSVRHRSIVGEEGDDFCHVAAVNGIDIASSRRQRITLSQC